eukprot:1833769-Amphidinium_carterae.1
MSLCTERLAPLRAPLFEGNQRGNVVVGVVICSAFVLKACFLSTAHRTILQVNGWLQSEMLHYRKEKSFLKRWNR